VSYERYREARMKALDASDEAIRQRWKLAVAETLCMIALREEQDLMDERRSGPFALYARWAKETMK